ncbi:unnamed protein product [Linum trigynum]|uniref:Terpene synthase n=1 Tax=Linum trigynum TaxID=586398 RepID=A0AAV2ENA7_9ROSI
MAANGSTSPAANEARTAEFHPTVWGDFFITHVFHSEESVSSWNQQIEALKQEVTNMLSSTSDGKLSQKLKLIDTIERLGIGYHFEPQIDDQLRQVFSLHPNLSNTTCAEDHELSTVALHFKLLRRRGYNVSSDTFSKFLTAGVGGKQIFKKELGDDVEGMLCFHEAAQLRGAGEVVLEEGIEFTTAGLRSKMEEAAADGDDDWAGARWERVGRALNGPKCMPRHEQLLYISCYEREVGGGRDDPTVLLSLAKLSWNVVQHLYHQELRHLTKWWIGLNFAEKLSFARDRLVEIYYWAFGAIWEPKFFQARLFITKILVLASVTDDIYDVRGNIDELELFTTTIKRWDTSMKDLPCYMKVFFEAVMGVVDEIGTITTAEGRSYCYEYLKQAEKNLTRAYLVEARWYANREVPSVEDYRRNGVYSSTYHLLICASLCGMGEKAPVEVFDWLFQDPKILVDVSDLGRLGNDVVSHEFEQERGHVSSSVECYMNQYDVSKKEAVDALKEMMETDRKDINQESLNLPEFVSGEVLSMILGLGWATDVIYQDYDSYTLSDTVTKDALTDLLVTPMR